MIHSASARTSQKRRKSEDWSQNLTMDVLLSLVSLDSYVLIRSQDLSLHWMILPSLMLATQWSHSKDNSHISIKLLTFAHIMMWLLYVLCIAPRLFRQSLSTNNAFWSILLWGFKLSRKRHSLMVCRLYRLEILVAMIIVTNWIIPFMW